MKLEDQIIKFLMENEKASIPKLCKELPCDDEFEMMHIMAKLERDEKVRVISFDRIYREDGGAIYLAQFGLI
jgi:hypothetical protein